jgi:hypothetical protein
MRLKFTYGKNPDKNKSATGLPDLSWYNTPKREKYTKMTKTYQMAIKYTNGSKIVQRDIKGFAIGDVGILYGHLVYFETI